MYIYIYILLEDKERLTRLSRVNPELTRTPSLSPFLSLFIYVYRSRYRKYGYR